ncbi:unnamed protein product [Meloidogyne enterolobii]|uniref:Uncharacterized protein n=1 Tax=Meloidogyne enterolobii TaxID=390850 RepID=A0ACB1AZ25_MELEN
MFSDGFEKDKVEIDKEIKRLNEEIEKYNKAYGCGFNLIKKKTLDSPSHKGSHRRGSREFGSNEEIRSNMSGELSVYSHNSNESGSGKFKFT